MPRVPTALAAALALLLSACGKGEPGGRPPGAGPARVAVPGHEGATKTAPDIRALRRAFDGAPPVPPHEDFGNACAGCHTAEGWDVPDFGFAPAMPHADTDGLSAMSRCAQCHVFKVTDGLFRESAFEGLRQDMRRGDRMHFLAPPVIPHPVFMRENCLACHDGPAARESIRTPHPERRRCAQCHVPAGADEEFQRP